MTEAQRGIKAAMGVLALHFTENRYGMSKQTADVLVSLQRKLSDLYERHDAADGLPKKEG